MKILILGGTGRIGRAVSLRLIENGNEVYIVSRGNNAKVSIAKEILCDINDYQYWGKILKDNQFDIIIDFLSYELKDIELKVDLCAGGNIKKYIFISSATVYNTNKSMIVNEKSAVGNPFSLYANNKMLCEQYLVKKWENDHFPAIIIRPSQTYNEYIVPVGVHGKRGGWQSIKRIIEGKEVIIHGDGNTMWTVTRSCDFAAWLSDIVNTDELEGEIIQVTSDECMTWNEIYRIIADEVGRDLNAIHISSYSLAQMGKQFNLKETILGDKARNIIFDNTKLKKISQYSPIVDMETGIRDSVKYILAHKEYQCEDIEFDKWCNQICQVYHETISCSNLIVQ